MKITLLITGGTIDKSYNKLTGELFFTKTHISEMLGHSRSRVNMNIKELMLIDSLDMTEPDRKIILKACKKDTNDKIIITHGSDTIVETAILLGKNISSKTIVLVGSIIPYASTKSDALFNLGSAIAAVQTLDKGIYITMNGKVFNWDNVVKNKKLGEFQKKN